MGGCPAWGAHSWTAWGPWGLAALVTGVFLAWLWRSASSVRKTGADREDSLRILRIRLARGEIGLEDYERLRQTLAA